MARKQPLIWNALLVFRWIVTTLPHNFAVAFGGFLGGLVPIFTKRKFKETSGRCSARLNISKKKADGIVRRVYRHFGKAAAEFARIPIDAKKINKIVTVHGEENLRKAIDAGRGVILATAHIGNWEYGAVWLAQNGYNINALGTDQRDDRLTKLIMDLRVAGGSKALGKATDLRAMMRALRSGEIIAVPVDQDARLNGVLSMFLGHPASTPVGIAKLAQKLGCAVLPGYCIRKADGISFDFHIYPALKGRNGEPYGTDIQSSIDDCNNIISAWIRNNPDQWMWMYPRWESYEEGAFDEVRN